ncbi:serrate RNA effector molecule [Morus notabilis]|uniref:serrate RNA effector molecule n=1 Tax=Morus notabilis TaxID=981085 RepID=UPI000CED2328|nr:serrate RNA effector molecule [Morus notabilis]
MSYKQFIQELEDVILPAEAQRRYQEYKSEYITTQKRAYFNAHKEEEWLKDKYHPTNLLAVIERRNELARKVAKDFLLDLQSGTLDLGQGLNALSSNKKEQPSDPNSEDEVDVGGKKRRRCRTPTKKGGGRSGRPGPQMSGPAPILALSSALGQDPRRIRSYQDLDAPEDEVTVIDYRSL